MIFSAMVGILIVILTLLSGLITFAVWVEEKFGIKHEFVAITILIISAGIFAQILYSIT